MRFSHRRMSLPVAATLTLVVLWPGSSRALPTFTDVSVAAGASVPHSLSATTAQNQKMTGGSACGDYDNDGWLDLYVPGGDLGHNRLLRNNGDGTFTDVAVAAGVDLPGTWGNGATFADWNGDGWLDLFVGAILPSQFALFENDQDGTFTNVTGTSGVVYGGISTFSASFGDLDNDRDLDMVLAHWRQKNTGGANLKHFWRNDGALPTTLFTEADTLLGYENRGYPADYTFAYNFADLDSDGWTDVVCASDYVTSHVWRNNGDGTLSDVTDTTVIYEHNGMGSAVADYDKDGDLDWFVTSIMDTSAGGFKDGNRMYRNLGDGTFEDATDHAGVRNGLWGWGCSFQDFDNDGWLDIYQVNGWIGFAQYEHDAARLFHANGDSTFTDVAASVGAALVSQGRGVSCFDYDRDGDVDIFVTNTDSSSVLFRNDGGNASNWLHVKLAGSSPNTEEIGARITAVVGASSQLWEIRAGNNYISQDPAEAHFGLGSATQADTLVVEWTDGSVTTMTDVAANQLLTLSQSAPSADLEVGQTVDDSAPDEGQSIEYRVTAKNHGPDDATGVEVTDLLPTGVTYASDIVSRGSYSSGNGVWMVGAMASGDSATLDVTATVDLGTGGTMISNVAAVTASDQADSSSANDADTTTIDVQTVVAAPLPGRIPRAFALSGGRPNPFSRGTTIALDLPARSPTELAVFDVGGRLVRTLVNRELGPGRYAVTWDGRDASGRRVVAGVYLVRARAGSFNALRKIVRLD